MLRIKAHGERWGLGGLRNGTTAERKIKTIGLTLLPAKTSLSDTTMQCIEHRFHCRLTCVSSPPHPPNSYVEALWPQCDSIWRWGLWEIIRFWRGNKGRALNTHAGISILTSTDTRDHALSSSCTQRGCARTQQGGSQGESSQQELSASTLTSDSPAPRSVRNKYLLIKSPSLWCLYGSPNKLTQVSKSDKDSCVFVFNF